MNKKFLSAILFGALMVSSTGTFVSCKDYDDDIENLQGQIDKNSSAIAELQKLVGAGNWVTSISPVTGGFTVTMSNGQSQTITGINGADGKDGKNGTEWTIGEDGFWYMDGEKTDNVAIGKNGENGVTAPSPSIGADGNWVVYNWDAEKGEFVAEATEIPAQGTAAYAVEANGVITLHIADANGEYMEVVLPTTCDSFVVEAPYKHVDVKFEISTWARWGAFAKTDAGKALLAKYPELAEIEKNAPMKQGGLLPMIVTPAAVELTDAYSFSLQNVDGSVANIALSNPVKGVGDLKFEYDLDYGVNGWEITDKLVSRSASEACLWSLAVEPAYNKKTASYASTTDKASLVVENEKGTAVRTAFAYTVAPITIESDVDGDVDVVGNNKTDDTKSTALYAESIDLFAPYYDNAGKLIGAPVSFVRDYKNHYIILVKNALVAEKYGLSIAEDGHTLNIAKMPQSELNISVDLTVIALGLNGSVKTETIALSIGQEITAVGSLGEKTVTLGYNSKRGDYKHEISWSIDQLGFETATQLNQFLKNADNTDTTLKMDWSYTDENGTAWEKTVDVTVYDENHSSTSDYSKAKTFSFILDSKDVVPGVYDIRLTAKPSASSTTVIYAAEGTMTIENPTTTAIKLAAAFVDENGILQITGDPLDVVGMITYRLKDAFVYKASEVTTLSFEDMDSDDDKNWIPSGDQLLKIYQWSYTDTEKQDLYKVRNFKLTYSLFGNTSNTEEMEFQAQVVSEIYSADPSEVITLTEARLTTAFGAKNKPVTSGTDLIDESLIDFTQITKAVYAAGTDAGKEYNLWYSEGTPEKGQGSVPYVNNDTEVTDYSSYLVKDGYLVNASGLPVEITKTDLLKIGMEMSHYMALDKDAKFYWTKTSQTYKVTIDGVEKSGTLSGWDNIWTKADVFMSYDKTATFTLDAGLTTDGLTENEAKIKGLFESYYNSFKYTGEVIVDKYVAATEPTLAANGKVVGVEINFVDPTEYGKYATVDNTDHTLTAVATAPNDVVGGQVIVPMYIKITDAWGMVMKHEFNVTIKTVQE